MIRLDFILLCGLGGWLVGVRGETYALVEERGLFLLPAFIKAGNYTCYQQGDFNSTTLLVDTLNRQSFLFGPPAHCRNCPTNYVSLAAGAFQALPGTGKVCYGVNRRVSGRMGVTEVGITDDPNQQDPSLNWLQQTLLVTQGVNVDQGATFSGNFAMGRSASNGHQGSMIGNVASFYGKDFDFCLDCGLIGQSPSLIMGLYSCASLVEDSGLACGGVAQLPIYALDDPTWNVALSSFQYGPDAVLPQVGMLIFDTTKVFSVFPYCIAQAIANGIAKRISGREATRSVVDKISVFSFKLPPNVTLTTPLLINFTSDNPYTSPFAKYLEIPPENLLTIGPNNKATFNFVGSSEDCIVGSADGPRFYLGTKFMRGKFILFNCDSISIIQTTSITADANGKCAEIVATI